MIHCDRCGEDYAASYKSCPFCDEMEYEEEGRPRGGRRLAGNTRGGGYGGGPSVGRIILTVLSLALIVAAVMIVISIIKPLVDRGQTTLPEDSPAQNTQQLDSPAPGETRYAGGYHAAGGLRGTCNPRRSDRHRVYPEQV